MLNLNPQNNEIYASPQYNIVKTAKIKPANQGFAKIFFAKLSGCTVGNCI